MEPNEYELMTNEQLATGLLSEIDVNEAMCEEAARRLRTITALQEKIDGMIERPTIGIRVVEREGFPTRYLLRLNEFPIDVYHSLDSAEATGELLTTALGMDDAKEGGGG